MNNKDLDLLINELQRIKENNIEGDVIYSIGYNEIGRTIDNKKRYYNKYIDIHINCNELVEKEEKW